MVESLIAAGASGLGMASPVALAVQGLYGVAAMVGSTVVAGGVALNTYLNDHIQNLKGSDNPTISRTGHVLEMVKFGFGVGWVTGVAVIATGQLILGNSFLATTATLVTAPVNPIAMTCAAIGAVYFGWNALSEEEKTEILEKLSKGLEIGVAFITSIIQFVLDACKKVFSAENLEELKKFVGKCAALFGRTLSSITHKITDVVADTYYFIKQKSGDVYDATVERAGGAYDLVVVSAESVTNVIKEKFSSDNKEASTKPENHKSVKKGASAVVVKSRKPTASSTPTKNAEPPVRKVAAKKSTATKKAAKS